MRFSARKITILLVSHVARCQPARVDSIRRLRWIYPLHVKEVKIMSREIGERYRCDACKAELVYEKGCPCGDQMVHSEICCGKQMTKVEK